MRKWRFETFTWKMSVYLTFHAYKFLQCSTTPNKEWCSGSTITNTSVISADLYYNCFTRFHGYLILHTVPFKLLKRYCLSLKVTSDHLPCFLHLDWCIFFHTQAHCLCIIICQKSYHYSNILFVKIN